MINKQKPISVSFPPLSAQDAALIDAHKTERIVSLERQGEKVWIKRQDIEKPPFGKVLHAKLSFLLPAAFMRASPVRSADDMTMQEVRKIKAFQDAGFPTPEILAVDGAALMISDVGLTIQKRLSALKKADPKAHDAQLIAVAGALGHAHAKGLAHGRPHPRDMFMKGEEIGFFDFEEEPEAVMPLNTAQARDAWLLFFQITGQALDKIKTPDDAFAAWEKQASPQTINELRKIVGFFSIFLPPLKLARLIWLGADGQRMLSAMEFFHSHLKANK